MGSLRPTCLIKRVFYFSLCFGCAIVLNVLIGGFMKKIFCLLLSSSMLLCTSVFARDLQAIKVYESPGSNTVISQKPLFDLKPIQGQVWQKVTIDKSGKTGWIKPSDYSPTNIQSTTITDNNGKREIVVINNGTKHVLTGKEADAAVKRLEKQQVNFQKHINAAFDIPFFRNHNTHAVMTPIFVIEKEGSNKSDKK